MLLEHMILDISFFLLISQNQHIYVHVYILCTRTVYIQIYAQPLAATDWREPTPHINNHAPSLYSPNLRNLERPLRSCLKQRLSADRFWKPNLLFCPQCRWQPPPQSRVLWVSAGLNQAHCFRPFPAGGLLCFSLRSLGLVAASGMPQ